ncbi:hypothetical protein GJN63_28015, partial [Salmonella enterica subsp. enterica serovar Java]|nr:hypothetical protein [Salmonella enterica subsp. enterica serovar Java]
MDAGLSATVVLPDTLPEITLFNPEVFEWRVHTTETELACRELVFLLGELDRKYGLWGENFRTCTPGQTPEGLNRHICTRLAGAVTTLFSRPGFSISDEGYVRLMNL